MLLLARKNLFSERTRLVISVGGVALAVFLISLLLSLYRGWDEKVGGFVENSGVDIWVAREGTIDFLSASSILPLEGSDRFDNFEQTIEQWSPLIVRPMVVEKGSRKMDVSFIGFMAETRLGGPIKVEKGKDTPGPGEVIVDKAMTKRYGLHIGDTIMAAGNPLEIVGISSGGDFIATQTVFVLYEEAERILELSGYTTFFVLDLRYPSERDKLADSLEQEEEGILAIPTDEFADSTRSRILGSVLPILSVILILAFIVGLAVAGLTIYTATVEKSREYGILKAVGFANRYLYRVVFEQSLVTGLLGFIVGVGLTLVVGPFASDLVPQFVLLTKWQDIIGVALITLIMACIAAYIPVRRLAGIDPVVVFKA